jgi:CBS domain containing-hemolysin-like protein
VPSTVDLDSLLDTLQENGLQMAVVIDEFGGTDGLVTIEDLLEELVGEVVDEHDRVRASVRRRAEGEWSVPGLMRPDEIYTATGVALPDGPDYDTLGGLVLQEAGRIPVRGDAVEIGGPDDDTGDDGDRTAPTGHSGPMPRVRLVVERMDGRRIDRVLLEVLDAEPAAAPDGPARGGAQREGVAR